MSVFARIEAFNKHRIPHLRQQKYLAMSQNPFVFFRGTCHLFYQDWPVAGPLDDAPLAWLCGDLHLENFGTFKGNSGQTYFDLNDFDEAALAPCTWDLTRFLTSILVAGNTLGLGPKKAELLCRTALQAYAQALAAGRAEWVDRAIAGGMIGELLQALGSRKRVDLLNKRTVLKDGKRQLKLDGVRLEAVSDAEREAVTAVIADYAATQPEAKFFKVLDCAFRIAGTGSRGLRRYAILVRGHGSPDENYLLDLKQAVPSALTPWLRWPQPLWASEAHRVIAVQHRVQAMSPAFSTPLMMEGEAYVLRALQPLEDRLDLAAWNKDFARLEAVTNTMARLLAWGQLRSSGRQGSACADELIAFGSNPRWQQPVMDYACHYAGQVVTDWESFVAHSKKSA
jgi:uncharacterized protein (DUF2252 family)